LLGLLGGQACTSEAALLHQGERHLDQRVADFCDSDCEDGRGKPQASRNSESAPYRDCYWLLISCTLAELRPLQKSEHQKSVIRIPVTVPAEEVD